MKKLVRPKTTQKSQRGYLNEKSFQDYVEQQLKNLYDYLEEDVLFDDINNTKTTITLGVDLAKYDYIEIWYVTKRTGYYTARGSQKIQSPVGAYLNINTLARDSSTTSKGVGTSYKITNNQIILVTGMGYEINNASVPITNSTNYSYITRITGKKL